jgi:hypothetical protein
MSLNPARLDLTQIFWDVDEFYRGFEQFCEQSVPRLPSDGGPKSYQSRLSTREVMTIVMALMVYTLAEPKLRQALEDQNQTVRDQRKQPTAQPTFRWIMQKFQGIHWINLEGQRQISNLTAGRRLIIRLLGPPVERYYQPSG